jgi:LysW-gamma-L-alpha-aminoadipyl-6-phosphate/LysW-L-glutamyl-5-phosphate reductase
MAKKRTISIIGGSGYTGGELLRILISHPCIEIQQVTSESNCGKFVHQLHPNLRGRQLIRFCRADEIHPCDVLFLAMPHGKAQSEIGNYAKKAEKIIDLSADFRLRDAARYKHFYGEAHSSLNYLKQFVYGLPEVHRDKIRKAKFVSGVGCNATAAILALYPFFKHKLVKDNLVFGENKCGSSEAGSKPSLGSHHPERSHAVRSYKVTKHRHIGEMEQELGTAAGLHISMTAIELVRGILGTYHFILSKNMDEIEIRKLLRREYGDEPFIRIVKEKSGVYRYPEPKILAGSNYCDIGFELDEDTNRLVVISAIDNLMKGAAGTAVQCMNLMCGYDETTALEFTGLHPV